MTEVTFNDLLEDHFIVIYACLDLFERTALKQVNKRLLAISFNSMLWHDVTLGNQHDGCNSGKMAMPKPSYSTFAPTTTEAPRAKESAKTKIVHGVKFLKYLTNNHANDVVNLNFTQFYVEATADYLLKPDILKTFGHLGCVLIHIAKSFPRLRCLSLAAFKASMSTTYTNVTPTSVGFTHTSLTNLNISYLNNYQRNHPIWKLTAELFPNLETLLVSQVLSGLSSVNNNNPGLKFPNVKYLNISGSALDYTPEVFPKAKFVVCIKPAQGWGPPVPDAKTQNVHKIGETIIVSSPFARIVDPNELESIKPLVNCGDVEPGVPSLCHAIQQRRKQFGSALHLVDNITRFLVEEMRVDVDARTDRKSVV